MEKSKYLVAEIIDGRTEAEVVVEADNARNALDTFMQSLVEHRLRFQIKELTDVLKQYRAIPSYRNGQMCFLADEVLSKYSK